MNAGPDAERVQHRTVVLQPGELAVVDARTWADTLVVVLTGELELLCRSGTTARFGCGAVLTLARLPVLTLHNPGPDVLTLHTVRRHGDR